MKSYNSKKEVRVLIVENEKSDAELMARAAEKTGLKLKLKIVENKKEYQQALNSFRPDIILCDYRMPDIEAPEALEILSRQSRPIPFIIVSGSIGEELAIAAIKSGATDYVMKDRLEKLPLSLKRALDEQHQREISITKGQELQKSEERYRTLVETQVECICRWLPDTTLTFANKAYAEYFGCRLDEIIGKLWIEFIPQEARPEVMARYAAVGREEKYIEYEHAVIDSRGERRWMRWIDIPLRDENGGIREFQSIGHDITAWRQAQEALKYSEDLLKRVQRVSRIGAWEWDVNKKFMTWSEEVYRIHDMEPEQIPKGSSAHIERSLQCYSDEDRLKIEEAFRHCLEKGEPYELVCRFTTVKGRKLWVRTAGQAVIENGRVVRVFGDIQDITLQKENEEQLRRQYLELKQWQELMLNREDRILELKQEVNQLLQELGRPEKYIK